MSMEALEPAWTFFERRDGGDKRLHLNFSGGHPFDGLGIFTGGGARALQAYLPGDDFLQGQIHVGRNVADKDDGSAFARGVNRGGDGFVAADTFDRSVNTFVMGELQNV